MPASVARLTGFAFKRRALSRRQHRHRKLHRPDRRAVVRRAVDPVLRAIAANQIGDLSEQAADLAVSDARGEMHRAVTVGGDVDARYGGAADDPVKLPARALLDERSTAAVRTLGLALRLAYTLCGGTIELLSEVWLDRDHGPHATLAVLEVLVGAHFEVRRPRRARRIPRSRPGSCHPPIPWLGR